MTDNYPLNWELNSLYPHPESDEFRAIVDQLKSALNRLADTSDELPQIDIAETNVAEWSDFLTQYATAHADLSAINAFFGCHASAGFSKQFRDFLIATGCQDSEAAVEASFGHDLRQPDFWNHRLDVIEHRVPQFLELAG